MVVRLACRLCGDRPLEEWVYGSSPDTPGRNVGVEERDPDRAFMVANVEGATEERWFHEGGCRRWQTITRDTTRDRRGVARG